MILVTGTLQIDPGQRDAFVEAARTLMATTREEAGCEHYAFTADLDDEATFHIAEQWASEPEMDAHSSAPHFAAFLGAIGGMVKGSSITKWSGATAEKLF